MRVLGDGADNFRTIVGGAGFEGGGGVDGSDGGAFGSGVNIYCAVCLEAMVLEVAKSLKVATEVRWSATRSLAVHSLTMHSLAECSSATEALALEAAAWIIAVEARSAAVLTVVGGAGEEGGGACVGGGIENVAHVVGAICVGSGGGVDGRDGGAFGDGIGDGIGGVICHGGGGVKYFNDAIVGGDCSHVITAIGDIVDGRDSDGQASIAGTSVVRNTNRD